MAGLTADSGMDRRRRFTNNAMTGLVYLAVCLAVAPLVFILADVAIKGVPVLNVDFFTHLPTPVGISGGGIANAIVGSFIIVGIASLISIPIGVGAGIFFSEWPESRLSFLSSFMNDVLAEFPSIVVGIFVFVLVVLATGTFSALAGALALAIIMLPIVARTTEESLKLVPRNLREASMALGVARWKTVTSIVISTGRAGLFTGIILAIARAAGETAPLLFTAEGNTFYSKSLMEPTAALPLLIYTYGISPFVQWQDDAWGAALVLIVFMLALNLIIKLTVGRRMSNVRPET